MRRIDAPVNNEIGNDGHGAAAAGIQ